MPLRLVCAWCEKVIEDGPPGLTSHGICTKCAAEMRQTLGKLQEQNDVVLDMVADMYEVAQKLRHISGITIMPSERVKKFQANRDNT